LPSLFIGKIGNNSEIFEVHALTNGFSFRGHKRDEMSDSSLFHQLIKSRYKVLKNDTPIYCTAVNPNINNETETNPHDERPGTVHIAVLNKDGSIISGTSLAVDLFEKDKGEKIGLPLENRWRKNGFPEGDNLDKFRNRYLRLNYNLNRDILPGELVELYRHFKLDFERERNVAPRLAVYYGAYNLLKRDANKKGIIPTWIWVFDAIPAYFNLYRYAGAAILRESSITENSTLASPGKRDLKKDIKNNYVLYNNSIVSRKIVVPIPKTNHGKLSFIKKEVSFLDGVIDIIKIEKSAYRYPLSMRDLKYQGVNTKDLLSMRGCLSTIGSRTFQEFNRFNIPSRIFSLIQRKYTNTLKIQHSDVGDLKGNLKKKKEILFKIWN